ncbi:hypothetical protein HET73_04315 [Wolbachia endosymbiont of Atemnus politus]|uniref:hypothetical protein n=1 Tax=Wolbachia endosymbiont of Atemnus politus TaxID=2682840 RepID=UPI0015722630|nr:hypothetical protein [Wolbachia endosymbiont of Atemnus politus]NSM56660.1 hypothetical protein [Wolbachia endosymbiont of Atemnus politus]
MQKNPSRQSHYHATKDISDSKLVFDLQDQRQKFSKKLKVFIGEIIGVARLLIFFTCSQIALKLSLSTLLQRQFTVLKDQNSHHGDSFVFFLFDKFLNVCNYRHPASGIYFLFSWIPVLG